MLSVFVMVVNAGNCAQLNVKVVEQLYGVQRVYFKKNPQVI